MTVGELIAQIQEWPSGCEVVCAAEVTPPGGGSLYSVVRVGGIAGASISGRDSVVAIWHKHK